MAKQVNGLDEGAVRARYARDMRERREEKLRELRRCLSCQGSRRIHKPSDYVEYRCPTCGGSGKG